MKTLTIYRICSYILIVVGLFIGLAVVLALFIALANPALLLNVFVAAAVVMYSFSSFLFLMNGIDGGKKQKSGLKDFIRVNAFVAVVFSIMNIFQAATVIMNPAILNEALSKMSNLATAKQTLPLGVMLNVMKGVIWFLLFYSVVLLVHIQFSFRFLKQYAFLFSNHKLPE